METGIFGCLFFLRKKIGSDLLAELSAIPFSNPPDQGSFFIRKAVLTGGAFPISLPVRSQKATGRRKPSAHRISGISKGMVNG